MINNEKHMIQLGTGDVDMQILSSPGGNPVIVFNNRWDEVGPDSAFMGFANAESIDGFIEILKKVKREYYSLNQTQRFNLEK